MDTNVQPWVLVEQLFDIAVGPERLGELIAAWDAHAENTVLEAERLAGSAGAGFAQQVATALHLLEQLHAAEFHRVNDLLASMIGAAMVIEVDGSVVASNEAAATAFGLRPGSLVRSMPLDQAGLDEFCTRIAEVSTVPGAEAILRLSPFGLDRTVLVHLKAMRGERGRARVLAVTSEVAWSGAVSETLAQKFTLTLAEIEIVRLLAAGGTVAGIASATGRSQGTVRSQLHAVLEKTGARSQAEVVRLAILLLQSVPAQAEPHRPRPPPEQHQRFQRMPDGRRIEVLSFGDPGGRPVIWMQSSYGFFRLPRAAELDLARRHLNVIVPFRAGWCGSDPAPPGCNALDVAVADLQVLMSQLRITSAPIVAPGDDLRIALMLAEAAPARVRHIFGIGAGFPIRNEVQYRRLIPVARFARACARYTPNVLPFMMRGLRVTISRYGLERYLRGTLARVPADARAMADPEIASAFVAGVEKIFLDEPWSEAGFCRELPLFHEDWPERLGHVACPVTLIHGEQDGNAPFETMLEYCAMYPAWRYIGYPDEGELVAHVHWGEALDLIESALVDPLSAPPARADRPLPQRTHTSII